MASGTFQTSVLLAPLVSTTASLLFSIDQQTFLSYLVHPTLARHPTAPSNALLPAYFKNFFIPGLSRVLTFLTITTTTTVYGLIKYKPLLLAKRSGWWYVGAASLAIGHLGFVPLVAHRLQSIMDDEGGDGDLEMQKVKGGKTNVDTLKEWLAVNLVRTWTVDVGAWICAGVAVVKTLS